MTLSVEPLEVVEHPGPVTTHVYAPASEGVADGIESDALFVPTSTVPRFH